MGVTIPLLSKLIDRVTNEMSPLNSSFEAVSPTTNISEKCHSEGRPEAYWSVAFSVTVSTITALLLIIGLFSNGLVIVLLWIRRRLRTTPALLLANVALIELLYFLIAVPISLFSVARGGVWPGTAPCQINGYLTIACSSAVWQGHAVIAAERYAKVVHPFKSYFTRKRSIVVLTATWASSVGIALLPVFSTRGYSILKARVVCGPDFGDSKSPFPIFFTIVLFVPLAVMVFCQAGVYRVARRVRHRIRETHHCHEPSLFRDKELGSKWSGCVSNSSSGHQPQLPADYPKERNRDINNQRLKDDINLTVASFQSSILYFIVFVVGSLVQVTLQQTAPMDAMSCHLESSPAFYASVVYHLLVVGDFAINPFVYMNRNRPMKEELKKILPTK